MVDEVFIRRQSLKLPTCIAFEEERNCKPPPVTAGVLRFGKILLLNGAA